MRNGMEKGEVPRAVGQLILLLLLATKKMGPAAGGSVEHSSPRTSCEGVLSFTPMSGALESEAAVEETGVIDLEDGEFSSAAAPPFPVARADKGATYNKAGPSMDKKSALQWTIRIFDACREAEKDVESPPEDFPFYFISNGNYRAIGAAAHHSKSYSGFHHLLYKNTYKHSGWMVCSYAFDSKTSFLCPLVSSGALRKYNSGVGGISAPQKHTDGHESQVADRAAPKRVAEFSPDTKRSVADAAVAAVAHDMRPFNFMERKCMKRVLKACVEAGQSLQAGQHFYLESLVPSDTYVKNRLTEMIDAKRGNVTAGELEGNLKQGGGMTSDGWTCKATNRHYYDVSLSYIGEVPADGDTGLSRMQNNSAGVVKPQSYDVEILNRLMALTPRKGSGTADHIRFELDEGLKTRFGPKMGLDAFLAGRTLVTDRASTMPKLVGASVSANVAKPGKKWVGCLSRQFNTATKWAFYSHNLRRYDLQSVVDFTKAVKTVCQIFKQGAGNCNLPVVELLKEEGATRFFIPVAGL